MTENALTIALSKGRIFEETLPLLAAAGIVPAEAPEKSRKLIIGTNHENIRLRIATKYPNIAAEHFAAKGVHVDIIKLYGSMELAPLVGLSDAIVDLVSTGNTLKANGLEAVEHIADISSRLVVNKAALKTKHTLLEPIIQAFGSVVNKE